LLLSLLNRREERMVLLINNLQKRGWVTLSELSKSLDLNERTIRNTIQYMNELIAPCKIISSKKFGVQLEIAIGYSRKFIYSKIMQNNLNFNMLELLFFEQVSSIEELADSLFSSTDVVRKAIATINQSSDRKLRIDPKSFKIIGDERWITTFFRSFFLTRYNEELPFDSKVVTEIELAVKEMYEKEHSPILPLNRNLFVLFVVIRFYRLKQDKNNRYSHKIPLKDYPDSAMGFNKRVSAIMRLDEVYDFYRDIWRPEKNAFFFFRLDEFQKYASTHAWVHKDYAYLSLLLRNIEERFKLTFDDREKFIFDLYNVCLQERYFISLFFDKVTEFNENIRTLMPFSYVMLKDIIQFAPNPFFFKDRQQGLYNILSAWDGFMEDGLKAQPKLKIAMHSKYNNLTFHNNFFLLNSYFQWEFEITLFFKDIEMVKSEIEENFDLLITDIEGSPLQIDCFCFPYNVTTHELELLKKYYRDKIFKSLDKSINERLEGAERN